VISLGKIRTPQYLANAAPSDKRETRIAALRFRIDGRR